MDHREADRQPIYPHLIILYTLDGAHLLMQVGNFHWS